MIYIFHEHITADVRICFDKAVQDVLKVGPIRVVFLQVLHKRRHLWERLPDFRLLVISGNEDWKLLERRHLKNEIVDGSLGAMRLHRCEITERRLLISNQAISKPSGGVSLELVSEVLNLIGRLQITNFSLRADLMQSIGRELRK